MVRAALLALLLSAGFSICDILLGDEDGSLGIDFSKTQLAPVGKNWRFRCYVKGYQLENVTWYKDGQPFTSRSHGKIAMKNANRTVFLRFLLPSDEGVYTCVGTDRKLGTVNRTFTLLTQERIHAAPYMDTISNVSAVIGSNVSVRCAVTSDALAHFRISYLGRTGHELPLEIKDNLRFYSQGSFKQFSEINLFNVNENMFGRYICLAGNNAGNSSVTFWLHKQSESKDEASKFVKVMESSYPWAQRSPTVLFLAISGLLCVALMTVMLAAFLYLRIKSGSGYEIKCCGRYLVNPGVLRLGPFRRKFTRVQFASVATNDANYLNLLAELSSSQWHVGRDTLLFSDNDMIGEGNFGRVYRATATELHRHRCNTVVALKFLKDNAAMEDRSNLLLEMRTMLSVGWHPNVVRILGLNVKSAEWMIVLEYCALGDLRGFLSRFRLQEKIPHEKLSVADLISFMHQIAQGMKFLSSFKCIHRDLAARNILLDKDRTVKIADFGLARETLYRDYYRKRSSGCLPLKWMAPETLLDRVFTTKSDIWSFGVLMWEIFTLGRNPYPGITVEDLFDLLNVGYRMKRPENCSEEMYNLMLTCWEKVPDKRPTFKQLSHNLRNHKMAANIRGSAGSEPVVWLSPQEDLMHTGYMV